TRFTLNFGDFTADSSQTTSLVHTYRRPNSYRPIMTLADSSGCIVQLAGSNIVTVLGSTPFFSVDKHAFCDSGIVNFVDYSISNDGFYSESYNFGDGSPPLGITSGSGAFNAAHDYDQTGTIVPTLTIVTTNGCTESYSDTIKIHQTPHGVITATSSYCAGPVQFEGSLTGPVSPMDTVKWAWDFGNGQTSNVQNPVANLAPGNLTATLRTSVTFGCSDTTGLRTTVFPPPGIQGPKEITTPVGIPVTIPFIYGGDSIVSYNWVPASHLDCPTCPDPVATVIFSTDFTVTVTDIHQCSVSDSVLVKTVCNADNYFLPNTFSPNGDGVNDYFYPRGTSLYNIQSLTIFNRWGQMVFQRRDFPANSATMGWDGNFNGRPAPADAYVYVAEVICENAQIVTLKGTVTLIR
ncbi:MAG TPA: gliding motility-associated C-terminal domain-containing protein, partial [Puia sp.]|nr:gliding motility-associated C-terminal domain-containing protein [Puia sp.]